jgi:predicted transcriptional regulator
MAPKTITINIGEDVDHQLDRIALETGQDKPTLAKAALIEWLEDWADVRDAEIALSQNDPASSIADVRRRLGLER